MFKERFFVGAALTVTVLLIVASISATGAASGVTLAVDAPDSASPGERITVRITVDAEVPLYGIQYSLSYPGDSLSVQRVEQGTFFSEEGGSLLFAKEADESDGRVEYGETRQNTDSGLTGTGVVTRITFVVDADPGTEAVRMSLTQVKSSNPVGQPIDTTTRSSTLTIDGGGESGTSDEQSTATSTGESTTANQVTAEPWRQKLTAALQERLADSDELPVIVVVAGSADIGPVANELERQGGNDVETLASIHAIAAVVDGDTLEVVAQRNDVERIRYDSRTSVTTTTGATTTAEPTETTASTMSDSSEAGTSASTRDSADTGTSASSPTSTSADGFTVAGAVLGLLVLVVYVGRDARRD